MTRPTSKENGPAVVDAQSEDNLPVSELARFLRDLGLLLQCPGNGPALGQALVRLSNALRQHPDKELDDVLAILGEGPAFRKNRRRQESKALEGVDLQALETSQVKELLVNKQLSKQDLIQVGSRRLGLSKSQLERESKQAALESVTSALQNEEAYHIISKEAEKEGLRRAGVQRPA